MRKILLLFQLFIIYPLLSTAQMNISFPMENAVFQRNSGSQATIYIAGKYNTAASPISTVEAQLLPINGGTQIGWTTIATLTGNEHGLYYGSLSAVAGWYTLNVRTKNGSTVVESTTLNRVGVGEVFIISGQSNSQGILNYGSVDANDERVINHNYDGLYEGNATMASTYTCSVKNPPFPVLSKIIASSLVSKYGQSSWAWGKLGDLLSARLGVPIAFYDAGASGSSSKNWIESAQGLPTIHSYLGTQYCNTTGSPYSVLRICMNYYASLFGVRAILWHQGETDTGEGVLNTTYTNNINYIINKIRTDYGFTVPWLVSRVSYNQGATSSEVILGQNNLVNTSNKIFSGPNTDGILPRVRDNLHFSDASLLTLASAFDASLDANFFNNATPISALPVPKITSTCNGTSSVNLIAPAGYVSYKWVSGNGSSEDAAVSINQSFSASTGTFRCWMKTGNNYVVSQAVDVANALYACSSPSTCTGVTYLSNLVETGTNTNGLGPIEKDKSNGGISVGDGTTLKIRGTTFSKGLGVMANSQIVYNLNSLYGRFVCDIGIDDETISGCYGNSTVIFQVYKDNILAYQSPTLNKTSALVKLNINVTGTTQLKLVVNDAGDGNSCDHADWAGARLMCIDTQAPNNPTSLTTSALGNKCSNLSWTASTDNMEVQNYYVYKNNVLIDSVAAPKTTYNLTGLTPNTTYNITIKAKDFSGNLSTGTNLSLTTANNNLVITASKSIVNSGEMLTLTATGCNSTVTWFNGQTGLSINYAPTTSGTFKAVCGTCSIDSSGASIQVLTPCQNAVVINTAINANVNMQAKAGQTIIANNTISNSSVIYQAGNSICLLPGFKADNTNTFVAQIKNCNSSVAAPTIGITAFSLCSSVLTATGCSGTTTWNNGSTGGSITASSNSTANYYATCTVGGIVSAISNNIKIPNLPVNWMNNDVGSPPSAGCTYYDGSGLTMKGTGTMLNSVDQFHYVYESFSATNLTFIAKISNQTSANIPGMRSGIIIRNSAASNDIFYSIFVENNTNNRLVAKAGRSAIGQNDYLYGYDNAISLSDVIWLKIVKVGNTLTASYSKDGGTTWINIGNNISTQPNIAIGSTYTIGFVSYNDNYASNSLVNQTTFNNISINGVSF